MPRRRSSEISGLRKFFGSQSGTWVGILVPPPHCSKPTVSQATGIPELSNRFVVGLVARASVGQGHRAHLARDLATA